MKHARRTYKTRPDFFETSQAHRRKMVVDRPDRTDIERQRQAQFAREQIAREAEQAPERV
jgi:hypothetical protein